MSKMRVARKALLITGMLLGAAWGWSVIARFTNSLHGDTFGYLFLIAHVGAFCTATTATVAGIAALVRSPDTRKAGGYFIVGLSASLWVVLSTFVIVVPRLTPSDPSDTEQHLGPVPQP